MSTDSKPTARGPDRIPTEELIAELRAGYEALGYPPTASDMDNFGGYGNSVYFRRFGSWIEALEAADIPIPESRRAQHEGMKDTEGDR